MSVMSADALSPQGEGVRVMTHFVRVDVSLSRYFPLCTTLIF